MNSKVTVPYLTKPLPGYLLQRYRGWKAVDYSENQVWYRRLATEGQRPRCMVISCCDSRVHVTQLFGAGPGEFFMHRNIANLVPPYAPDTDHHGTSAAVEYAVNVLKVTNLIVMGHSMCGGVEGCRTMCSGHAPELEKPESFVGRWLDILRPGYERVKDIETPEAQQTALEQQTVLVSLENLSTFPFVRDAVENGNLSLHGVWVDIASGELQVLDNATQNFTTV
ncbi:carbonic anhydrase [Meridianimarinicoccus aquatilis]|uniref:Carbonic anhydrase n=1 Tax=Meridianimarinicoccus aquatilis TaxID=2552766 RepID=A0A4R6AXC5_9RHOB|nr:carbonic anhydrase [Fluviibacterium aquatile]QIE40867.1 carbonic anhydrase [Rhodobacteraceae bacterium SC52]TDL86996.1 carbonic anhydrase [Fluviibacterium aquatile]